MSSRADGSLDGSGKRVLALQGDVTVEGEVQASVDKSVGHFGRISLSICDDDSGSPYGMWVMSAPLLRTT